MAGSITSKGGASRWPRNRLVQGRPGGAGNKVRVLSAEERAEVGRRLIASGHLKPAPIAKPAAEQRK
jgi:hypothetical protein